MKGMLEMVAVLRALAVAVAVPLSTNPAAGGNKKLAVLLQPLA